MEQDGRKVIKVVLHLNFYIVLNKSFHINPCLPFLTNHFSHLLGPDDQFFTGDDVFYFTILQDPSDVFAMVYDSYNLSSPQRMNMDIHQYLSL